MISITKTADSSTPLADLGTPEDFLGLPSQDDGILEEMLLSAIEIGEAYTGRKFFPATYQVKFGICDLESYGVTSGNVARSRIALELSPLTDLTSVTLDTITSAGSTSTRAATGLDIVETYSYPFLIINDELENLNGYLDQPFTVIADAGHAQGTLPRSIIMALKQHVAFMFANRGDVASESMDAMPEVVKRQYGHHRIMRPAYAF